RAAQAAALAEQLRRFPVRVAAQLKTTGAGCSELKNSWIELARLYTLNGGWTDRQRAMACDLLGMPHALREEGSAFPEHDDEAMVAVFDRQIAGLEYLKKAAMDARDEQAFALSQEGIHPEENEFLRNMRRYEREARRHLKRALDELKEDQARMASAA